MTADGGANPWGVRRIYLDASVADSPMARRAAANLPGVPSIILEPGAAPPESAPDELAPKGENVLYLKEYKGRFLRPCPGTRRYHCCGYQIIHIGENCPMDCSYCILKAYFRDNVLKVWANQEDQFRALHEAFGADRSRRFRVGTGEFTDSLALESVTGHTRDLVTFLKDYDNVVLELKSKWADLSWLSAVSRPDRVLSAWSLNAPEISRLEEGGVSSLEERLKAARVCADAGVGVCLHFDPVIHYPGWREGYARTIDMIFEHLKPREIVYVSMGSFRYLPELGARMRREGRLPGYMAGEFVAGLDGKTRLLRSLRVPQLRFIASRLAARGLARKTYLCMESSEVWRDVFGGAPGVTGGAGRLAAHLRALAFDRGRPA